MVLSFVFILLLNGCSSPTTKESTTNVSFPKDSVVKKPDCVDVQSQRLIIRWGDLNMKTKEIIGYQLNTDCTVYRIKQDSSKKEYLEIHKEILSTDYCRILKIVRNEAAKTQTLNSPGETSRFVEYAHPESSVFLRFMWNPKFQNDGSKGFRQVFDSLTTLIKK